jgi:lantibiotic modifying enzyme
VGPPPLSVDWSDAARTIGRDLRDCARQALGGEAIVWLKPERRGSPAARPETLGPHLYAGATGIALFLAALGSLRQEEETRELALRALTPLRRQLARLAEDPAATDSSQLGLGGLVGLGSFIYVLARTGRWLGEPSLIAEACLVASWITPERIEQDTAFDVMYGSAGALLSLLLLEREAPSALAESVDPLGRAVAVGEHLLRRSIPQEGGSRGWPRDGQGPGCGFAHGASGISHALARLAERTRRDDFRRAALEGLAFERLCYCPDQKNWRSSLRLPQPRMTAWCNGAPGVALGRLGIAGLEDERRETHGEILTALETTHHATPAQIDCVCCGNAGRAEVLLQAARTMSHAGYLAAARELAAAVVTRLARRRGTLAKPGFFNGMAGIGYTFLRLSSPGDLPCVLALE